MSIPPVQEHTVLNYWSFDFVQNSGPAFPLLVWFFAYFFFLVFWPASDPKKNLLSCDAHDLKEEHLPPMSKNLTVENNNWSYKEYHDYKEKFGLEVSHIPNEYQDKIEDEDKFKVSGIHSYDILRNPLYAEKFQYISMYIHDLPEGVNRNKIHFDGDDNVENNECQSDLVRLALFLPYMSQDDQASFRFSENWW